MALVRGRIQHRQNRPAQAEATFRGLIECVPQDSDWANQAWGELALMKDEQGDFAGALDAMEQCKRAQRTRDKPYWKVSENVNSQMREIIETITRDDFRRWRDALANFEVRRTALLTGFPRSGTTLLEQMLDSHPDLVSSEERDFIGKELLQTVVGSFGKMPLLEVLNTIDVDKISHQRQQYFRFMEYLLGEPIAGRMHLDKNPAYNLTIPLVLRFFPETRLIVALRDPARCCAQLLLAVLAFECGEREFFGCRANCPPIRARHDRLAQVPRADRDTMVRNSLRRYGGRRREAGPPGARHAFAPVGQSGPRIPAAAAGHQTSHESNVRGRRRADLYASYGSMEELRATARTRHENAGAVHSRVWVHRMTHFAKTCAAVLIVLAVGPVGRAQTVSSLRVMTYNILTGGATYGPLSRTVGVIQTAQADVIGIQEVGSSAASIASSLGFYYHGFNSDTAIISRYPIAEVLGQGVRLQISPTQDAYIFDVHLARIPISRTISAMA